MKTKRASKRQINERKKRERRKKNTLSENNTNNFNYSYNCCGKGEEQGKNIIFEKAREKVANKNQNNRKGKRSIKRIKKTNKRQTKTKTIRKAQQKKCIEILRKNEAYKNEERNKNCLRMKEKRKLHEDYRANEKTLNKERMQRIRQNETYNMKQRKRNKHNMKVLRRRKEYVILEKKKNIIRNWVLRQRMQFAKDEMAKNIERNRILRENQSYKDAEALKNIARNVVLRNNMIYTRNELRKNISRNKKLRKIFTFKKKEQLKNMKRMRCIRSKHSKKQIENEKDRKRIRRKRENMTFQNRERQNNKKARKEHRETDVLGYRDRLYNDLLRRGNNIAAKRKLEFFKFRSETPSFVCCCCEGLFYRRSVVKFNEKKIADACSQNTLSRINNYPSGWICNTCKNYAHRGQVHKLSTSNGLQFVKVLDVIKDLTDLEERMVSPVLNFMQIRALKPYALNPQLGLKGSVVNIPIELNDILRVLPRSFKDMQTIQVKLKRHENHKSDYMFESIRPEKVSKALKYLVDTPLYKKYEVKVDSRYIEIHDNNSGGTMPFIVDDNDITEEEKQSSANNLENFENQFDIDQINNDEVLLINNDADIVEGYGPMVNIIAPGQDKQPLPWHKMDDLDELCFPKIFAGYTFSTKALTYTQRIKSEARRYDRRSCIPTRLLFMAKKCLELDCVSSINICLRRTKKNVEKSITAKTALNCDFTNELIAFDDGYRMLKHVRSSPAYWEHKKKEVLAMIRQLGRPTFFLTLSAGESKWPELLQTLMKYSEEGHSLSKSEAYNLDMNVKTRLVRNDPVTCARYFDHKVHKFMWLLRQNQSIFEEYVLIDSYERVEFQQRGSPHEHILLWLRKSPEYKENDAESEYNVIRFIDRFMTCRNNENSPYMNLQTHKHTHTCYKGQKNKQCRFHIPYPVMKNTMILTPLNKDETAPKSYKKIDELMNSFYKKPVLMSFEDVLKKLNMTEVEYILAIRSTLKQKRVFLKRTSLEVSINSYNEDILELFESNIDLQFVLDEYAVISYITNYISKVDGGLSKLLRQAAEDCTNENHNIKSKFRKIANVFLNSNIMSAQEAAYHVLSLALSKKSRMTIFINTGPIAERVLMMKSEAALRKLDQDSTEIYMDDIFERYSKRPKKHGDICVAVYAANFQLSKRKNKEDDIDTDDDEISKYKQRHVSAVIRYRRYRLKQDPANYYREKILLFMPWRNEKIEVENVDYEEVYKKNLHIIEKNQAKYSIISDETLDDALEHVLNDEDRDNEAERENHRSEESAFEHVDIAQQGGEFGNVNHKKKIDTGKSRYTVPVRIPENELHDLMLKLNCKQREFVMHVLQSFKTNQPPFQIFLSGSAGVGKSTVINTLCQLITNYFDKLPGGDMDKIIVLLCAPSGKAAFLINGVTLHLAFALPCQHKDGVNLEKLSSDIANTIREKLSKVQLLVIDEISMVSSTILGYINTRLRQIKGVNQPFGGVPVLAVGDLNQLPPVMDKPVYKVSNRNQMAPFLDVNPLWDDFQFYELTEIMRQKNDLKFINALNNLARGKMSEEDVQLIKTREIKNENQAPETAIRLYATNKNVSSFNAAKIARCPSDLVISTAETYFTKGVDAQMKKFLRKALDNETKPTKDKLLPKIELKIGIKYMVTNNIVIEDGLVNGACGVLKRITFKENSEEPSILWIDFQVSRVGPKARARFNDHIQINQIDKHLTPIERLSIQVTMPNNHQYQIIRNQFPVIPAEAITIHKSQGQTYDNICLDFRKKERRSLQMLYVALSRVTKLDGLYILGKFEVSKSIMNATNSPAQVELSRLRNTRQMKLLYNNLKQESDLNIIYFNVGTLRNKLMHIISDEWFLRSNVLILTETLMTDNDEANIENYRIVFRSNYGKDSRGIICYMCNHLSVDNVHVERQWNDRGKLELIALKIQNYYVITGYKSPQVANSIFTEVLREIMKKIPNHETIKLIVMGDFNFNIRSNSQEHSNHLTKLMNTHHLKTKLPNDTVTTTSNTQIDVIFANFDRIECGVYETYFSYHKPIYAILNPTTTMINDNIEEDNYTKNSENQTTRTNVIHQEPEMIDPSIEIITRRNVLNIEPENEKQSMITKAGETVKKNKETVRQRERKKNNHLHGESVYDLNPEQCHAISRPGVYADDLHINLFHGIMNRTMNERGVNNFAQDTGYIRAFLDHLQPIPLQQRNIQIIYSGDIGGKAIGHWICTYSDGTGKIHIYDSLNCNHLVQDQKDYLDGIYRFPKTFIFHKVQNQTNGIDCGIFAMYFATLLCFDEDPSMQPYRDPHVMRRQASTVLLTKCLTRH